MIKTGRYDRCLNSPKIRLRLSSLGDAVVLSTGNYRNLRSNTAQCGDPHLGCGALL